MSELPPARYKRERVNEKIEDAIAFGVRLRPQARELLEREAKERKVSMNTVVNDAIVAALAGAQ